MEIDQAKIEAEILLIKAMDPDRALTPENMEKFARDPMTEHHKKFLWDDNEAGLKYRLIQARGFIRVHVIMVPRPDRGPPVEVSAYVSLPDHRGRGYEEISAVINTTTRKEQLLIYTIKRLLSIREVEILPELDEVSKAIKAAADKYLPPEEEEEVA